MRVVSIAPRQKKRYAVGFDRPAEELPLGEALPAARRLDAQGLLLLDADTAEEAGLRPGAELSEEELLDLIGRSDFNRAKSRALWLLGTRDYAAAELKRKLAPEFGRPAAEAAVRRMGELDLLDDAAYAARLAEQLLTEKKVSARDALYRMTAKGLSREVAAAAVEAVAADPARQIAELIAQRYSRSLSDEKGIRRVTAALARRGFSFDDIRAGLQAYLSDPPEET